MGITSNKEVKFIIVDSHGQTFLSPHNNCGAVVIIQKEPSDEVADDDFAGAGSCVDDDRGGGLRTGDLHAVEFFE
jgi:hypothetical protein